MQIKQNTSARVLVRLLDSAGAPVTGILYSGITAVVGKSDLSEATLTVTAGDWSEADNGLAGKGVYWLTLPTTATNQLGDLVYCVSATGAVDFLRTVEIIDGKLDKVMLNRAKIDSSTNRLLIYEDDGVTVAFSFNLKDLTGSPISVGSTERVPV